MGRIIGRLATPKASQYLQQLCKHFGHKVEASWDEATGRIAFSMALVRLEAGPSQLEVTVEADGAEGLARGREVIDSHLRRFAFREEVEGLAWAA
jgi:hypothetical protein